MGLRLIALLLLVSFLSPGAVADTEPEGRVPLPVIGEGKGDACVADTDFMRRHHMDMLLHQRDETVQQGLRTKRYSLKECVACHAVAGADGLPVKAEDPAHFCSSCHIYAAVQIDCFECHASRPETAAAGAGGGNGIPVPRQSLLPITGIKWK